MSMLMGGMMNNNNGRNPMMGNTNGGNLW
jgi:hypothetical protein